MLYRATECSKRAASPPRSDSPCGNNGGQLAMTGAPVSDETMPDSSGAMFAHRSTSKNFDVKESFSLKSPPSDAQVPKGTPRQGHSEQPASPEGRADRCILDMEDQYTCGGV